MRSLSQPHGLGCQYLHHLPHSFFLFFDIFLYPYHSYYLFSFGLPKVPPLLLNPYPLSTRERGKGRRACLISITSSFYLHFLFCTPMSLFLLFVHFFVDLQHISIPSRASLAQH